MMFRAALTGVNRRLILGAFPELKSEFIVHLSGRRVEVPGSGLVLFRDEVQLLERVPA